MPHWYRQQTDAGYWIIQNCRRMGFILLEEILWLGNVEERNSVKGREIGEGGEEKSTC